jgi:hypothetical protein
MAGYLSFNLEVKYYLKNEMYCELNSTVVMFSKSIFPLVTLSLDYHFHVCTPCMIRISVCVIASMSKDPVVNFLIQCLTHR